MLFYAHSGLRYLVLFAGILVLGYAVCTDRPRNANTTRP